MILSTDDQSIIAQCTPRGNGALALLRISGADSWLISSQISKFPFQKNLLEQTSHTVHYAYIIDQNGNTIDHVMLIVMRGPRTFTGQDVVEITCHNNQFIIEAIITVAIQAGARFAQEGEFTKRAFMNGKLDLVQAEAINELIHAQTQNALKKSLAQLEGSFSNWIQILEKELFKIFAWCQASFEFLDEEVGFGDRMKNHLESLLSKILALKKTFNRQQQIRQGIRIALIGSVNAGKSSIFNNLVQHKRAIVTNIAGTTRDSIEAGVYRNGNYWTLIDTAGLRQTDDVIEQEGIRRSYEEALKADIILLIVDGSRSFSEEEKKVYVKLFEDYDSKIILVQNKCDISQEITMSNILNSSNSIKVSSLTGENISLLEAKIEEKIAELFNTIESPFLLNQRQFNLLLNLEKKLLIIQSLLSKAVHYELIAYHLQEALEQLSELTGKTISETAMDAVFKEFCVGK